MANYSYTNAPSHLSHWAQHPSILSRIIRALKLDKNLYEEVEADKSANIHSITIILLSSIAAGIGSINITSVADIIINAIAAFAGWFLWAYITYMIGTRLLSEPQTQSTYGEMIRTIGFASTPGLFRIFGNIIYIGPVVYFISEIWMLLAMIIAIKHALDYKSTGRSVLVAFLGWIVQLSFIALILYLMSLFTQPVVEP